jgi:TPR repeat protein
MPHISKEELGLKISALARLNPSEVMANFTALTKQIEQFDSRQRDEFFEKLLVSFSLFHNFSAQEFVSPQQKQQVLLEFFHEFGKVRGAYSNVISRPANVKNLETLAQEITIDELSPSQLRHFATNLDLVGLDANLAFKDKAAAQRFLAKGLQQLTDSKFKGEEWIKNSTHFLLHCKNLGLLSKEAPPELMLQVNAILQNISNFVISYEENLNFSASDSQSCLDVFLYAKYVLDFDLDENAENIIARLNQSLAKPTQPSKAQLDIFDSIKNFLENKRGGKEQWRHKPRTQKGKEANENEIIFADILAITLEGAILENGGVVEKRADIVVKNIATGEIILVIEIDGPSHFLGDKETGKTRARNELESAIFKDRCLVIDFSKFGFYRTLKQQTDSRSGEKTFEELKFLDTLSDLLQDELDKIAKAQEEKVKFEEAAPRAAKKEESKKAAPKKPVIIVKSKDEITVELLRDFWKIVNLQTIDDEALTRLDEILSNQIFRQISRTEFKESPFDIALQNFNQAAENTNATMLLNLLWIEGFECQNRALILSEKQYPQELYGALGKERPPEKVKLNPLMVNQARRGNFKFMETLSRAEFLAKPVSDQDQKIIADLAKILLEKNPKSATRFFALMAGAPCFVSIEEEIFASAIISSNDEIASFLLERKKQESGKFFIDFFEKNPELISSIYDFKQYRTIGLLERQIERALQLSSAVIDKLAQSSNSRNASYCHELLVRIADKIPKPSCPQALLIKAQAYAVGTDNVSKNLRKALEVLNLLLQDKSLDLKTRHEAKLCLSIAFEEQKKHKEALAIYKEIAEEGNAMACYILSTSTLLSEREQVFFLKRAADLKFPKAVGLVAIWHMEGMFGTVINEALGLSMLQEGIKLGDVESMGNLGSFSLSTALSMDLKDPRRTEMMQQAFVNLQNAALRGSPTANFNLGRCYSEGYGTKKNLEKALRYYTQSLEMHEKDKCSDEMFSVDCVTQSILEVKRDLAEYKKDSTYFIAKPAEEVSSILSANKITGYKINPEKDGGATLTIHQSKMNKDLRPLLGVEAKQFEMSAKDESEVREFLKKERKLSNATIERSKDDASRLRFTFPENVENIKAIDDVNRFLTRDKSLAVKGAAALAARAQSITKTKP